MRFSTFKHCVFGTTSGSLINENPNVVDFGNDHLTPGNGIPFVTFFDDKTKSLWGVSGQQGTTHGDMYFEISRIASKIEQDDDISKSIRKEGFLPLGPWKKLERSYLIDVLVNSFTVNNHYNEGRYWNNKGKYVISFWKWKKLTKQQVENTARLLGLNFSNLWVDIYDDVVPFKEFEGVFRKSKPLDQKARAQLHMVAGAGKLKAAKGFGSEKKKDNVTITRYHQKRFTSESLSEANIGIKVDANEIRKATNHLAKQMDQRIKQIKEKNFDRFESDLADVDPGGISYFAKTFLNVEVGPKSRIIPIYIVPFKDFKHDGDPISGGVFSKRYWIIRIRFCYKLPLSEYDENNFKKEVSLYLAHEIAHVKDNMFKTLPDPDKKEEESPYATYRKYINAKHEIVANVPMFIHELEPWIDPKKSPEIKAWVDNRITTGKMIGSMLDTYSQRWAKSKKYISEKNRKFIIKKLSEFILRKLREIQSNK